MTTSLREQLMEVRASTGALTQVNVVDVARSPGHPLHNRFEWDDTIAGEKYRLEQAGELIRSVQQVFRKADGHRGKVREFHSVDRDGGHEYIPLEEVAENPTVSKVILADMMRDWQQFKRRYEHMQEFLKLIADEAAGAT